MKKINLVLCAFSFIFSSSAQGGKDWEHLGEWSDHSACSYYESFFIFQLRSLPFEQGNYRYTLQSPKYTNSFWCGKWSLDTTSSVSPSMSPGYIANGGQGGFSDIREDSRMYLSIESIESGKSETPIKLQVVHIKASPTSVELVGLEREIGDKEYPYIVYFKIAQGKIVLSNKAYFMRLDGKIEDREIKNPRIVWPDS